MTKYNLGFISDTDLFTHVKETVEKYRFKIDLAEFNKNLVDPIKLTFDSKIYGKDIADVIESEIIRQIDKSNTNHIGYFHQNIFKYLGNGWSVPETGYDVENQTKNIFVEMKNKHNTTNNDSSKEVFNRMLRTISGDSEATCFLVEIISRKSQDIVWKKTIDKHPHNEPRIRKISIDKFYKMVTGNELAFKKLCEILPKVLDDVIRKNPVNQSSNTVLEELRSKDSNILKSVYLLSFKKYDGFGDFNV